MVDSERQRILIVDDEEAILETMGFTFEDEYDVLTAPSALRGLELLDANAPVAVRETRRGVRELMGLSLDDAYRRQEELGAPLRKTEDAAEGARAFAEKRKPVWVGR